MQYLVNHKTHNRCKTFLYEFEPRVYFCYNLHPMTERGRYAVRRAQTRTVTDGTNPSAGSGDIFDPRLKTALGKSALDINFYNKIQEILERKGGSPSERSDAYRTAQEEVFKNVGIHYLRGVNTQPGLGLLSRAKSDLFLKKRLKFDRVPDSLNPTLPLPDSVAFFANSNSRISISGVLKFGLDLTSQDITEYSLGAEEQSASLQDVLRHLSEAQCSSLSAFFSKSLARPVTFEQSHSPIFSQFITIEDSQIPRSIAESHVTRVPLTRREFNNYFRNKFSPVKPPAESIA